MIHRFNEIVARMPEPSVGGRPSRLLDRDDEDFVVRTATTRPTVLGTFFTRWSIRKPTDHLRRSTARPVRIGREALRCLLARRGISFQRTKTRKESPDPGFDVKLARIEYAINERPAHTFAFDEFGPLGIRPTTGSCWAEQKPARPAADHLPAHPTYASWANPIEAHFGPLRQFTLADSHHPNHTVQARALHAYPRWRTKNARHVLAANDANAPASTARRDRWGGRLLKTA